MIADSSKLRPRMPLRLAAATLVLGLTALIAQVVLTRELLSLFLGNELSIAFVLAVWLSAVAGGSAAGARAVARIRQPEVALAWSQFLMAVVLPLSLLIARLLQPPGLTPGEAWGPGATLLASLETMALVCLVTGLQFVFAASAAARSRAGIRDDTIAPVGYVYALEAVGAVLGGIVFHLWLSQHVIAFAVLAGVGVLNVASGFALLWSHPKLQSKIAAIAVALPLAALLGVLLARAPEADLGSLRAGPRWQGYDVTSHFPSKYGDIIVARRGQQVSLFQSGVLLWTSEDDYANEVTAHLPLLFHPAPERVLLLGDSITPVPAYIGSHGANVTCVDLDPQVASAMREGSRPVPLRGRDPRSPLEFEDPRRFVRSASPAGYDVVIASVPDPTTASLNRFYTREFFQEVKRALAPDGLLAITLSGSAHHLSGPVLLSAAAIDATLRRAFPAVRLVPGDTMFFLASEDPEVLRADAHTLAGRLGVRDLPTVFVNDAWLRDALLPFRAHLIQQQLAEVADPPINTDLNPISYYHQTLVWLDKLSPRLATPARRLANIRVWWAAAVLPAAILLLVVMRGRWRRLRPVAVLIAIATVGGFGLVVEILGLLVFQAALGYLYHALGALIAAFMAGLAAGAASVSARPLDRPTAARLLLAGLLTSALVAALLPGLLSAILPAPALAAAAIAVLLALVGSLVGAVFPAAVSLYRREQMASAAGGAIYAADLVGSAGAAVFAGTFAVPLLGARGTAHVTALLLVAALLLAMPLLRRATR